MTKIVMKGAVFLDTGDTYGTRYAFFEGDVRDWGAYISVAPYTIEVEETRCMRAEQVAAIEKQRTELTAKYSAAMALIDKRVSQLTAITNDAAPGE